MDRTVVKASVLIRRRPTAPVIHQEGDESIPPRWRPLALRLEQPQRGGAAMHEPSTHTQERQTRGLAPASYWRQSATPQCGHPASDGGRSTPDGCRQPSPCTSVTLLCP